MPSTSATSAVTASALPGTAGRSARGADAVQFSSKMADALNPPAPTSRSARPGHRNSPPRAPVQAQTEPRAPQPEARQPAPPAGGLTTEQADPGPSTHADQAQATDAAVGADAVLMVAPAIQPAVTPPPVAQAVTAEPTEPGAETAPASTKGGATAAPFAVATPDHATSAIASEASAVADGAQQKTSVSEAVAQKLAETFAQTPEESADPAPDLQNKAQTAAQDQAQRLAETAQAAAGGDPARIDIKVSRTQAIKASIDAATTDDAQPVDVSEDADAAKGDGLADITALSQGDAPTKSLAKPAAHPASGDMTIKAEAKPQQDPATASAKAPTGGAAPSAAKAEASPKMQVEAAAGPVMESSAEPTSTPAAPGQTDNAQQTQQAAAVARNLSLSNLSHATIEATARIAAQMARRLDSRSTRFDMALSDDDLGQVDVSLEIAAGGQLTARFAFDDASVASDMRGRAEELRRQLQDAGFQVAGDALDFSHRDSSSGGDAFERQQQRASFRDGSGLGLQSDTSPIPAPGAWSRLSQTPDRVDVRV